MNQTDTTKQRLKKVSTCLTQEMHAKVKAAAAMACVFQEEWIEQAISEKLLREKQSRAREDLQVVKDEE